MNMKEYIEYLKGLSQKELISECIRLKRSYDYSCENWIMVEELRNKMSTNFSHLSSAIDEFYKILKEKESKLIYEYNQMVLEQETKRKERK